MQATELMLVTTTREPYVCTRLLEGSEKSVSLQQTSRNAAWKSGQQVQVWQAQSHNPISIATIVVVATVVTILRALLVHLKFENKELNPA